MFKNSRLHLVIVLLLAMFISLLAGCGSGKSADETTMATVTQENNTTEIATEAEVEKLVELSFMCDNDNPMPDSEMVKNLETKYGYKINFLMYPEEAYMDKFNITLVSGDIPDIMLSQDMKATKRYAIEGAFLKLNDLIDKFGQDIKSTLTPTEIKIISLDDGSIPLVPQITGNYGNYELYMRTDWLTQFGLQAPTNTEELYTVLKTFKEKDPAGGGKTVPISFDWEGGLDTPVFYSWFDTNNDFYADNGAVKFGPQEEGYKETLSYLNKLYKEKLLYSETFTANEDQQLALLYNNQLGSIYEGVWGLYWIKRTLAEKGISNIDIGIYPALKSKSGVKRYTETFRMGRVASISSGCKDQEGAMKFLNFLYSKEGKMAVAYGEEGVTFKYNEAGDPLYVSENGPEDESVVKEKGHWPILNRDIKMPMFSADYFVEFQKGFAARTPVDLPNTTIATPGDKFVTTYVKLSDEEITKLIELYNPLITFVKEERMKFVLGKRSFTEWDQYLEQLKKLKLDELMALVDKGYKAFIGS